MAQVWLILVRFAFWFGTLCAMRNMLCAAALLSIALVGAGCKKASPIVGKWTGGLGTQTGTFEFKPDNTMSISAKNMGMEMVFSGDYKLEGENLSITMKDVDIKGGDPKTTDMIKKLMKGQTGKEEKSTVKFVSDDEMSMTSSNAGGLTKSATTPPAITLKRVKEGS